MPTVESKPTLKSSGIRIKESFILEIYFFFFLKTSESTNQFFLDFTWFLMTQNQGVNSCWNQIIICKALESRNQIFLQLT